MRDAQEWDLAGSPDHGPKGSQEWLSSIPGNHGLVLEKRNQAEMRMELVSMGQWQALLSSLGVRHHGPRVRGLGLRIKLSHGKVV